MCANSATNCTHCTVGYFLYPNFTCIDSCPTPNYPFLFDDGVLCLPCNESLCYECVNASATCTSCFPTNSSPPYPPFNASQPPHHRYRGWLLGNECVSPCPDGFEANNYTSKCDQCRLGTYSFQNRCYSWCPQFYAPNDNLRACVLAGGYPLNMTVEVEGASMLKFTIPLPLGLNSTTVDNLSATWATNITLSYIA